MRRISPAEPVTDLRRIKIVDNGEPLINFLELCPRLILDRPRFIYRRETLLRAGVAERLCKASSYLPKGYRLAVIEGWRPPHIQRRMYAFAWNQYAAEHPDWSPVQLKRVVNRYTAPLDRRVPPPHTTGGAMDVYLADEVGNSLDLDAPYDPNDPKGFPLDAPGVTDEAKRYRDILAAAMIKAGITNYPSEFWHYSYGDQGWAYRGGHEHALYGAVSPENWTPDPADVSDEPLTWIDPFTAA